MFTRRLLLGMLNPLSTAYTLYIQTSVSCYIISSSKPFTSLPYCLAEVWMQNALLSQPHWNSNITQIVTFWLKFVTSWPTFLEYIYYIILHVDFHDLHSIVLGVQYKWFVNFTMHNQNFIFTWMVYLSRVHDIMRKDCIKDPAAYPNALLAKVLIDQVNID